MPSRLFSLFIVFLAWIIAPFQATAKSYADENIPWVGMMRVKALLSLDKLLALAFDPQTRSYLLLPNQQGIDYQNPIEEYLTFSKKFGFFSIQRPLIGCVSRDQEDINFTNQVLLLINKKISSPRERLIATAEILTKVVAYRDLKKGQEIFIPTMNAKGEPVIVIYAVDTLFDLWHGMPAFGLVPKDNTMQSPILLFRGTDLSLGTKRGWASVISDLNTEGPGLATFLNAQSVIHEWLHKVASIGPKARVMGFSLGGVLAAYTVIFERDLINKHPQECSFAFNPPGVAKKVLKIWEALPIDKRCPFAVFVTRGDLVSKIGLLFGDVTEFSLDKFSKPITAHVTLMTAQRRYHLKKIDVVQENQSR